MGLQPAGVIHNNLAVNTHHLFLHVRNATQPTITRVSLCHKKVWRSRFTESRVILPFNHEFIYSTPNATQQTVGNKTHVNNSILPTNIQHLIIHARNWIPMQNSQWHTNRMIGTSRDKMQPNEKHCLTHCSQPVSKLGYVIHRLLNGHRVKFHSYLCKKISATYGRSAEVTNNYRKSCRTGLYFCEYGLTIISCCVCFNLLFPYNTTNNHKFFQVLFIITTFMWFIIMIIKIVFLCPVTRAN